MLNLSLTMQCCVVCLYMQLAYLRGARQVNNAYSWTNKANVLWIDQPTGVGFSYGDAGDYDHDELGVRNDMYHFIAEFLTAHPEYADAPFYVFGESYGGHYAPNVAYAVLEGESLSVSLSWSPDSLSYSI